MAAKTKAAKKPAAKKAAAKKPAAKKAAAKPAAKSEGLTGTPGKAPIVDEVTRDADGRPIRLTGEVELSRRPPSLENRIADGL